ncbi:thioesterase superfamily [Pyrenophora seminiperda CCB06]|uniref:Thioesterase superfamily n=1 Tax=Pyrenophora seminiperda CCB06 TaxID=1302712 RepID=A0A3M7MAM3_9PLEO|nr:thioesterase superfamily [Pyrenophora seminiperda CCB06]
MDAAIAHFSSVPWAAELINDTANWTPVPTRSMIRKASGEDAFFAETISTDRTVRHILTLRGKEEPDEDIAYKEIKELVDVGDGLDGYPHVLHGGLAATLLDEACGSLIGYNASKKHERARECGRSIDRPSWMTACSLPHFTNTKR